MFLELREDNPVTSSPAASPWSFGFVWVCRADYDHSKEANWFPAGTGGDEAPSVYCDNQVCDKRWIAHMAIARIRDNTNTVIKKHFVWLEYIFHRS